MDSTTIFCLIIPLAIIIGIFVVNNRAFNAKQAALKLASENYQQALVRLRARPNDPTVKREALEFGRYYSSLTRENRGVTVFDEIALSNEISAAMAGAIMQPVVPQPAAPSITDRMRKLDELKAAGMISDAEYATQRQKIIEAI